MAAVYTILYPKTDKEFNLKYYLETHMPMVETTMGKFGLVDWKVVQLNPASGYVIQTVVTLDSIARLAEFPKEDVEAMKNDVVNYYDGTAIVTVGSVVGGRK